MLIGYINKSFDSFIRIHLLTDSQIEMVESGDLLPVYTEETKTNLPENLINLEIIRSLVFSLRLFYPISSEDGENFERGYTEEIRDYLMELLKLDKEFQYIESEARKLNKLQMFLKSLNP